MCKKISFYDHYVRILFYKFVLKQNVLRRYRNYLIVNLMTSNNKAGYSSLLELMKCNAEHYNL